MHTNAERPIAETVWLFNESQLEKGLADWMAAQMLLPTSADANVRADARIKVVGVYDFLRSTQARHLTCGTTQPPAPPAAAPITP